MLAQLTSYAAAYHPHPGWYGHGGPGWWIVFPILFWVLVLSLIGYVIYRRSPKQSAISAGERVLAEQYARGEISGEEYKQRRSVLRGKS